MWSGRGDDAFIGSPMKNPTFSLSDDDNDDRTNKKETATVQAVWICILFLWKRWIHNYIIDHSCSILGRFRLATHDARVFVYVASKKPLSPMKCNVFSRLQMYGTSTIYNYINITKYLPHNMRIIFKYTISSILWISSRRRRAFLGTNLPRYRSKYCTENVAPAAARDLLPESCQQSAMCCGGGVFTL